MQIIELAQYKSKVPGFVEADPFPGEITAREKIVLV
jgi:hypothetical protein